jgi:chromatin remodeling complex protein RSC6
MVATKKSAPVPETPVAPPVVPPAVPPAVADEGKKKAPAKPRAPAKTAEVVEKKVVEKTVEVVADKKAGDESGEGVVEKEPENVFQVLVDKIASLTTLNKEIQVVLKQVAKDYDKLKKVVDKIQKKRENARKSPSGFAKPNKISDELCDFIGVPHGTEKSRTDITRFINTYVKEHNLNKPDNKRIILPDEKLKKILNVKEGDVVTFFVLQRLISHHFPPKK